MKNLIVSVIVVSSMLGMFGAMAYKLDNFNRQVVQSMVTSMPIFTRTVASTERNK